jgi:hypothetical protein
MMMMDMCIDFHYCDANVVDSFKEPKFFLDFTQRVSRGGRNEAAMQRFKNVEVSI